jgi:hypothetical protein
LIRAFRLVTLAASIVLSLLASPALAATNPYTPGSSGYDVSYPNCGSATPAGTFAIVGVNHGRPFTSNTCLGAEYAAAPTTSLAPSLYLNTAYSGAYRRNITAACSGGGTLAWQIGCSEADYALQQAAGLAASVWWLDVETGNSWSSSNVTLNQQAIQGAVDRLNQTGLPVGVYSTASMWKTITGGSFTPIGLAADWVAAGSCITPFTNSPVWLTQATSGGVDYDTAC